MKLTPIAADATFAATLAELGAAACPKCAKVIDRGDVAWNNASTEAGTPCMWVEIQCQRCDTEIARLDSWWPECDDFEDLVEHVIAAELDPADLKRAQDRRR